ncbi:MAG: hypothetical protein FWG77_05320 [Treponema sp.]|nr:hypothetical protein [Treponema sp.]
MIKYRLTVFALLMCTLFTACSTGEVLMQIIENKAEVPVFLGCRPITPTEILFSFSAEVEVVSLNFDPAVEIGSIEGGSDVRVTLNKPIEEGKRITADILVEDAGTNTLNVIVPFRARNDRMPKLIFNEVRTEYSRPRVEFVEFLILEAGNLGALRLFIASVSVSVPVYEFMPAEINAGEYLVLNLRTIEDVSDSPNELHLPGNTKLLRRTDALWLMDQDDNILDALLLSENPGPVWASQNLIMAAELFGRHNAWQVDGGAEGRAPTPADAVITSGTTATRTINRDESTPPSRSPSGRAENWYITVTSGNSPGRLNNPGRHN